MRLPKTPSQTVGPYYTLGLCRRGENEAVSPEDPRAVRLVGTVYDGDGAPVEDAMVELWDAAGRQWARAGTDGEGRFAFVVAKPGTRDGEAPHFDAYVFARGLLKHQRTRVYLADEPANEADPVLTSVGDADRATLIAQPDDGALRFDVRLQGERQTVFFAV